MKLILREHVEHLGERGEIAPPKEPKPKRPCKAAEPQPALFIATEDDPCAA